MFNTAQPAWRDWAAHFQAHAAARKPFRDRWLKQHGFETEPLPAPADNEDDQGEDDDSQGDEPPP